MKIKNKIISNVLIVLPFVGVLILLLGSVWLSKIIHCPAKNVFHVNTSPDENGNILTVRVFDKITSVIIIDSMKHSHKKKINLYDYSYNPLTTELTITQTLPYNKNVIHIEGTASSPEKFCLQDFDGSPESLLVMLNGREAIMDYEWAYNRTTHILSFRNDISPEKDGSFLIMYQNENKAIHSFGNWNDKDSDRIAEVQSQWLHRTQNTPRIIMKDRSRISNRKLERETGFAVKLPKGNATFISEVLEGTEKGLSVMRWFDDIGIVVECKATPFTYDPPYKSTGIMTLGKLSVSLEKTEGTRQNNDGSTVPINLVLYHWSDKGTFYRISCETEQTDDVCQFISGL